jgi:hypothetical protein
MNEVSWKFRAGLLSQSCRVRAELVFLSRGRPYLHVIMLYIKLQVKVSNRTVHKADETEELSGDTKNVIIFCDCDKISKCIILFCFSHSHSFAHLISFTNLITHGVDT